jgi:Secretion system C-terminal sorting domain
MKKYILSFGLILTLIGAKAQVSIENHTPNDPVSNVSGGVITKLGSGAEVIIDLHVLAPSGSYWLTREKIIPATAAGWSEYTCWGDLTGLSGGCFSPSGQTWNSPADAPATLTNGGYGVANIHVRPNGTAGSCHYRYFIIDTVSKQKVDSVDIVLTNPASIKETKTGLSIAVYPNPASEYLNIVTGTTSEMMVKIVDVLGKVVYVDRIVGNKKVDLEDFKNGVYIVSLSGGGEATQTRRIVVKK